MSAIAIGNAHGAVARERQQLEQSLRGTQLALIVTGIALTAILSSVGVLPAGLLVAAKVALIATPILILVAIVTTLFRSAGNKSEDKSNPGDEAYRKKFAKNPFYTCVGGPLLEEGIFRLVIQGTLQQILPKIVPAIAVSVFGFQFPMAIVIAMVASSIIFGAAHMSNHHSGAAYQSANAAISSLFVEAPLFYFYGFWASFFAHCINNTIVACLTSGAGSSQREEHARAHKPLPLT
ncbi:MAG TPA: CPBP family intramembrane glutamic endopeptidase [Rhabdochlamydiaceae bacterium]|jgi:membrane protease YdiL (CAAX protease family)